MFKWKTDFFEWYGDYTELTFEVKEEGINKAAHLLMNGVNLKIEFDEDEVRVYISKDDLKRFRTFLHDI